jgi:methyl-accepting chemotaxis protein
MLLAKIVPDIQKTSELMQEIASSSREQGTGTEQVTKTIMQFDSVVQQNSAASEELAASAEELSGQSLALQDAMAPSSSSPRQSLQERLLHRSPRRSGRRQ